MRRYGALEFIDAVEGSLRRNHLTSHERERVSASRKKSLQRSSSQNQYAHPAPRPVRSSTALHTSILRMHPLTNRAIATHPEQSESVAHFGASIA